MKIQASCEIAAPIEDCFKVFSDLENLAEHVSAINQVELLTPGPIGVGTRFKETRTMFGKEASEVMEVTQFSPSEHLREEARSGGMHYVSDWHFSEREGKTRVEITFTGKPTSILARVLSPLFSLMAGSMKKAFLTDMGELKTVLEKNS
jgi:uncharacterized membrane protein